MCLRSGIHEECGVFGVIAPEPCDVAGISYYGLSALQPETLAGRCQGEA